MVLYAGMLGCAVTGRPVHTAAGRAAAARVMSCTGREVCAGELCDGCDACLGMLSLVASGKGWGKAAVAGDCAA